MIIASAAWLLLSVVPSSAGDILNAAFRHPSANILPLLEIVASDDKTVSIALPNAPGGQVQRMQLAAEGPGPQHRWAVFTMRNPELVPQQIVLSVPQGGFIGSGVMWPRLPRPHMIALQASSGQSPEPLDVPGADTYALTINPGFTATYAIELADGELDQVILWRRGAFEDMRARSAFFQGVVLGLSVLLSICAVVLFVIRPVAVFPAAGLFGFAGVAWLVGLSGYLPVLAAMLLPGLSHAADRLHGVVEAVLVAGLVALVATFLDWRHRVPVLFWGAVALFLAAIGLAGMAWADPVRAAGIARIAFFVIAIALLPVIAWRLRHGDGRARALLPTSIVLVMWTFTAAVGCMGASGWSHLPQAIAVGFVLVLLTLALALMRIGFGNNVLSRHFLEDSGRRALALAGSDQTVWDYRVAGDLYIGPELERALGYVEGEFVGGEPERWLDAVHPADRAAYQQAVDNAIVRGRGTFEQQFRLRRNDGTYRWYMLRARPLTEDGRTVRLIGTLTDVTSLRRSEERLLSDAVHDRITGLPNRALFMDRLERAIGRAGTDGINQLAVIVIDLDRFRTVNDGLGHEVADRLLRSAGQRIADLASELDTVARLPGDQFAVIATGRSSAEKLATFVSAVTRALARPFRLAGREIYITASAGVAMLGRGTVSADTLLKQAAIALYEAKRRGAGQVEFHHGGLRDERSELLALEQDLRGAVQRQEIEVLYQPIMRLADRELAGFEALVRWRHAEHGLLEPDAFMNLAEETGLIREIGSFVLNEAARQLGIWQRAFRPSDPLFVAVNVSSVQLIDTDLVRELHGLIARERLLPGTLKLELTETVLMQNPELSTRVLERIRKLGIGLACDDFGTGYSSFSNLRTLPFDTLKIDKSFIEADAVDERAGLILDSIVLLAHDLELGVVAEGVETDEQLERVAVIGCDYAQGYFIGMPSSARDVIGALSGTPFGTGRDARGGIAGLWDRLTGAASADQATRLPPQVSAGQGQVPPLVEDDDEALEPWMPPEPDPSTTLFEWAARNPEPAPLPPGDEAPPADADLIGPERPPAIDDETVDVTPEAVDGAPADEEIDGEEVEPPSVDWRVITTSRLGQRLRKASGRSLDRRAAE